MRYKVNISVGNLLFICKGWGYVSGSRLRGGVFLIFFLLSSLMEVLPFWTDSGGASVFAQSPSPYKGGSSDGFAFWTVSCTSVNIYVGGPYSSGFAYDSIACPASPPAPGSAPYVGSTSDGFAFSSVSCPAPTAYFTGGSNDGFSYNEIVCQIVDRFLGGTKDGFAFGTVDCSAPILYVGGPYSSGFAYDSVACPASPPAPGSAPYVGSSNDGFAFGSVSCPIPILYIGGSSSGQGLGFGEITCDPPIPLPLELLSLSGKRVNDFVELEWITASEFNTSHFEVLKMNEEGSFESIDVVPAAGFYSQQKIYYSNDEEPRVGYNYYRLKMFDLDGSWTHSNIVSVYFDLSSNYSISFYPNPATEWVNVHISGLKEDQIVLSIYDLIGRKHFSQDWNIYSSDENIQLDISQLPSGMYMITVHGLHQQYFVPNKLVKLK